MRRHVGGAVLCLVLLGGCSRVESPKQQAMARDTMVNVLVGLLVEQASSNDPVGLERVIQCEELRLHRVVGYEGYNALIDEAIRRYEARIPRAERDRVSAALALKEFTAEEGCDSLAAAGRLGGPIPPFVPEPRAPR